LRTVPIIALLGKRLIEVREWPAVPIQMTEEGAGEIRQARHGIPNPLTLIFEGRGFFGIGFTIPAGLLEIP